MDGACQVLDLDQYQDEKLAAQVALQVAAQTKDVRIFFLMLKSINRLMIRRKLRKIRLDDCTLYRHLITPRIRPLLTSTAGCPKCGSYERQYMQTGYEGVKQDYFIWGCRACGTVYGRWEDNEAN